jgi:hypothetical protein
MNTVKRFEVGISHSEAESLIRTLKFYATLTSTSPGERNYGLDGPRFKFRHRKNFFSSRKRSYLLRGSSSPHPPSFCIASEVSFLGLKKRPRLELNRCPPPNATVTIAWSLICHSHGIGLHGTDMEHFAFTAARIVFDIQKHSSFVLGP